MAILGNNVKGASTTGTNPNRMIASKQTLAAPATMTELHGWFGGPASSINVKLVLYADSSGTPAALVASTSGYVIGGPGGTDIEIVQTGFSVALAAGDYWIGWVSEGGGSCVAYYDASGSYVDNEVNASYATPQTPFGTVSFSGVRNYSCWAVVGASGGGGGGGPRAVERRKLPSGKTRASLAQGTSSSGMAEANTTAGSPGGNLGTGANADIYTPGIEAV